MAKTPVGGRGILNIADAFLLEEMSVSLLGEDILIEGYIKKEGV
jgi:diaminohydroxyphosphoribosylaminopyrimidine deaminase/5-amino-6-(5-phosphoribosylamino)uracil reductase